MRIQVDPGALALLTVAAISYAAGVRRLARRGVAIPGWQQAAWYGGLGLLLVALQSPLDGYSEELLVAHMGQHLLIADVAAPLLLAGIRWPMHLYVLPRPVLVLFARRRVLRRTFAVLRAPWVALPLYVLVLIGWHLAPAFEGAVQNELVHGLQHQSFIFISVLVWWPAIEPHRRHLRGELWKIPHVLGARIGGMFLGMAFIFMRVPAYQETYALTAGDHGLTPLEDQQLGGALMLSVDFFVVVFVLSYFFWRASVDFDRGLPRAHDAV